MAIHKMHTDQTCPHCKGEMDRAVDTVNMIHVYICNECGAQYEAHPENSKQKVGKRVVEPK